MADKSAIEWTDATWNPIVGCSVVSPGCANCYAMRLAGTRLKETAKYKGLTQPSKAGPVWTGEVRRWDKAFDEPLRWRAPRMIFVNSEGDLFHEDVPDEWIDRVFAVIHMAPHHTYQILTKRPKRMREYINAVGTGNRFIAERDGLFNDAGPWPLPHVWLGVSAERQQEFDERWPELAATDAAVRFVSYEPALGLLKLGSARPDWVICGGESGSGARYMLPTWARLLRDECASAGVAFFMKQMTGKAPIPDDLMVRQTPTPTVSEPVA